jgi:hypothetical protein
MAIVPTWLVVIHPRVTLLDRLLAPLRTNASSFTWPGW